MQFEHIRRNVVERLKFIEQRLYWEGRFQKTDLVQRFSISIPQASADVAHYQRIAPGNTTYDTGEKAFVPGRMFKPMLMDPDARAYLSQLLLLADNVLKPTDSWLGVIPPHAAIPKVRRRLSAEVLRAIVRAIRNRTALEILYQSFSSPEPKKRWVAPHGLAFDGFRWHTRAWCYTKSGFIDLVLARFLEIGGSRPAEINGDLDREWNEIIEVKLAPHPDLPEGHRRAIELDYGMDDGVIAVPMRLALYYYFERQLCLDIDVEPARKQVVVLNRDEIEAARSGRNPAD